ncbi:hypothetical protein OJJOAM_000416 [Cupriavidus sp. H18C1]
MAHFSCFPGALALSAFRQQRLLTALQQIDTDIESVHGQFLHFVDTDQPLDKGDTDRIRALLTYGAPFVEQPEGDRFVVIPRFGTISPVGQQGHRYRAQLRPVACAPDRAGHRIHGDLQEGPAARPQDAGPADARRRGRAAVRPHDRDRGRHARRRGRAVRGTAGQAAALHRPGRRPCRAGRGQRRDGPGAVRGRDRLSGRCLRQAGPQPDRRRADDVRAGQQRTLPPQDLQRDLDHRRRGTGQVAVRDDPQHAPAEPAGFDRRVFGQLGGDGGRCRRTLVPARRRAPVWPPSGADPYADEGRDA